MTVADFIAKWRKVDLKERSAAQEHFIDLCNVFEHPTPAAGDPTGATYCFEKGISKHGPSTSSGQAALGFADVWKKDFFGWEYKGKHKDLNAAYNQLLLYRDALANPPLLVLCDLDRIIVRTNFTGTVSATHEILLERLGDTRNIEILRAAFHNPEALRPGRTSTAVTQDAARHFAEIAAALRERGLDPAAVAHFLDRIVFCLFAEDTGLLPDMVFTRIVAQSKGETARFCKILGQLFDTMAAGGDFGAEPIRHFNGNLFDDRTVLDLTADDMARISAAAGLDWSAVDPSIFGTLFERGLDPAKRAQLGAHFTSREDIELVVDAVVMAPLRREWAETKATVECLLATGKKSGMGVSPMETTGKMPVPLNPAALRKARMEAESILHQFLDRLRGVRVLDPACGSGNFLYVALARLKDLEKEAAVIFPSENGLNAFLPGVGPWQLHGIEINAYAHDLAQMTVWIGWLQWIHANGFGFPADPVLRSLSDNIRHMDSIVSETGEPEWPAVDFIIGNPPFLGGKMQRRELGDVYVDRMLALWKDRVPAEADLCCYWFEKARAHIAAGKCRRAGLLATQGIRSGTNRQVLKHIKESGDLFWAESDRNWILDGANVHVSMVGFDDGTDEQRTLDGNSVSTINANLTSAADLTLARPLPENADIFLRPPEKGGAFELTDGQAVAMLNRPNPHGRPNSDVLRPWVNAEALVKTRQDLWIIDYPAGTPEEVAACYEKPMAQLVAHVKPAREANRDEKLRRLWWLHRRTGEGVRTASKRFSRLLCTPRVSKHRIFVWIAAIVEPDTATYAFAREDDFFFGVMHSRFHEVWSLAQGSQLREKESGFRYTPTTCFETFPFPRQSEEQSHAIAEAACELNALRERWLNPPEWTMTQMLEFPAAIDGPWCRFIASSEMSDASRVREAEEGWTPRDLYDAEHSVRLASEAARAAALQTQGIGMARYPRLVALDIECSARLKDRTLTKLYNERPTWLDLAHRKLDAAVAAAYGWPADLTDDAMLERLLALNLERSQ
jgi:methylase of polypeptide subunit release factors